MRKTPVYIICSPRPLVGKTLIARLLCEFLLLHRGSVVGFDVNTKEPSLIDFLPNITETAEIDNTLGQMQVMDRLIVNDGVAKVIDLGYPVFDEFFTMVEQIGFFKEAARRGIAPFVLFVGDNDRASLRDYAALRLKVPERSFVTVDNEFVLYGEVPEAFDYGKRLKIATLAPFLRTYIDKLDFSFTAYLRAERDSSAELYQWIRANYFAFREFELRLMLMGG